MTVDFEYYDRDYYERGLETGKSCYSNYRWMPEQTMSMAMTMIDFLGIRRGQTVLDYGCSKGYLVKAFNLLHRNAWGVDVSKYAIDNVDVQVKDRCFSSLAELESRFEGTFDFCIAKDVFEHVCAPDLNLLLRRINAERMLSIVPLGSDGQYRAPANDLDSSHVICEDEGWWVELFKSSGWVVKNFTFRVSGIKESYYNNYPDAHGFFYVEKQL